MLWFVHVKDRMNDENIACACNLYIWIKRQFYKLISRNKNVMWQAYHAGTSFQIALGYVLDVCVYSAGMRRLWIQSILIDQTDLSIIKIDLKKKNV